MSSLYFPKPQPLSPSPKRRSYMGKDGRYYQLKKGKEVLVKGVEQTESIYYWWFEYLKRNEDYKKVCEGKKVKGMAKLYKDFGNIFDYEFWDWWNKKGQYLFGISSIHHLDSFTSIDDVLEHKKQIENGEVMLVALPTNLTRSTLHRRLTKLVSEMELNDSAEQRATYHPNSTKVDVESLQDCLLAYDLKQQGKTNVYIGGSFLVGEDELREYVRDGRSKSKTFDFDALEKFISKKGITAEQYDELNEKGEGVFFVGGKKRTASKNYLNVKANRMIAKAKANIKAVGEGQFPKATPQHLVVGKKHL